jgi:hypothetical protein
MRAGKTTVALGVCLALAFSAAPLRAGETFTIARLKYGGGGDWYTNPTALPDLMRFVRENTGLAVSDKEKTVSLDDEEIFGYPVVYMTGHGNVSFTSDEAATLRRYLIGGGFLIANDNYGMDASFRREIKKAFPDKDLVLLPNDNPVFRVFYTFPGGLPKVHEHDGLPAQAFAIFHEGRMVVFYAYQSDIGNGWEDASVYNDPPETRTAALKMGTNLIMWALSH